MSIRCVSSVDPIVTRCCCTISEGEEENAMFLNSVCNAAALAPCMSGSGADDRFISPEAPGQDAESEEGTEAAALCNPAPQSGPESEPGAETTAAAAVAPSDDWFNQSTNSSNGARGARPEGLTNLSPFKDWDFQPFLAPSTDGRPTLVLDIDETLLHASMQPMPEADRTVIVRRPATEMSAACSYEIYLRYRPGLREFLRYCVDNWEVVIFTASRHFYAGAVIAQLERDFPFFRVRKTRRAPSDVLLLHRDHCTPTSNGFVKDLHLLGRDLARTVLVDNNGLCGAFQPYNLIKIANFMRYVVPDAAGGIARAKSTLIADVVPDSDAPTPAAAAAAACVYAWSNPHDTALASLQASVLVELSKRRNFPKYLFAQRHSLSAAGAAATGAKRR